MLAVCIFFATSLQFAACTQRDIDLEADELELDDKLPETIWIGSRFGLIPYDIDWLYYNKTKEHFMKDTSKHPQRQTKESRTLDASDDDNKSKSSAKGSAPEEYGGKAVDDQKFLTSVATTHLGSYQPNTTTTAHNQRAGSEVTTTSAGSTVTVAEPQITTPLSIPTFSKYSPDSGYNDENSALAEELETSESIRGTVLSPDTEKVQNVITSGYGASTTEDARNETNKTNSSRSRLSAELTSSSEELQSHHDSPPSVSPDSIRKTITITTATVASKSTAPLQESQNKKNQSTPQPPEHTEFADVGKKYSFSKHTAFKGKKIYKTDKHKARKSGNCDRVTDILALSNYLQVKIIESLLYESISWPRGERSHFRGMVNHMRRELQAMDTEKEQLKVIRSHLLRYMGSDKDRQNLVLPLTVGEWGSVLQLLECLQKRL